jgi:RNA polymerase sigma factor (sigma-70 family)
MSGPASTTTPRWRDGSRYGRAGRFFPVSSKQPPFQRFLDEHRDAVWSFLVASLGRQQAEDCFQETFLAALRAYPRLRPDSNTRAWVMTIARNKAIEAQRAGARAPIATEMLPEVPAAEGNPERSLDGEVWASVHELPERQRAAVLLRYLGDLAHRDIAAALDCSEEAARRSLHEGMTKLRKAYAA